MQFQIQPMSIEYNTSKYITAGARKLKERVWEGSYMINIRPYFSKVDREGVQAVYIFTTMISCCFCDWPCACIKLST